LGSDRRKMPCLKVSFESDAPIGMHVTASCAHGGSRVGVLSRGPPRTVDVGGANRANAASHQPHSHSHMLAPRQSASGVFVTSRTMTPLPTPLNSELQVDD
jgi:hypothetical protein